MVTTQKRSRNSWLFAVAAIILLAIGWWGARSVRQAPTTTDVCKAQPTMAEGGVVHYPVDPKYKSLQYLGQIFTAHSCGRARLAKIPGVEGDKYTDGLSVLLQDKPNTQITNTLKSIGFICDSSDKTNCRKWLVNDSISIDNLLKLEPYSSQIVVDSSIRG